MLTARKISPAFTLVELVLVVAILAVIAAMAVPRYALAVDRYRADAAARKVAADIRWAHSRALAVGGSRTITFTPATSTYFVSGENDPDRPNQAFMVALASGPYAATITSAGFGGTGGLTFNGFGVCATGGAVVIRSGSCTKTIQIDSPTGAVSIR